MLWPKCSERTPSLEMCRHLNTAQGRLDSPHSEEYQEGTSPLTRRWCGVVSPTKQCMRAQFLDGILREGIGKTAGVRMPSMHGILGPQGSAGIEELIPHCE